MTPVLHFLRTRGPGARSSAVEIAHATNCTPAATCLWLLDEVDAGRVVRTTVSGLVMYGLANSHEELIRKNELEWLTAYRPCPKCGEESLHVSPEMVDAWNCPAHGNWGLREMAGAQ